MLTILYHEIAQDYGDQWPDRDRVTDRVQVWLRKWTDMEAHDVILETQVVVDGDAPIRTYKAFHPYGTTDAEFQRMAIARFDQLLANHPNLGPTHQEESNV